MSVVVQITQSGKNTKAIGQKFLRSWTDYQKLYWGVPDQAYVLDNYEGGEDIRGQQLILFDRQRFGRGMSLTVDENYDIELVLNYPATAPDIRVFYRCIKDLCRNFKLEQFFHEDEPCTPEQLDSLEQDALSFNARLVQNQLRPGLTIFGCIYPVVIEEWLVRKLSTLTPPQAHQLFEEYLY